MADNKSGRATRDFNDAGTGASYKGGETVDVPAGVYANYEAAGLVEDADPAPRGKTTKPASDPID